MRFHLSLICLPTFLRPCSVIEGIPWLPSFPQLEGGSCSALSQLRGQGALLIPVVVVTWEMSSVLLCSLGLGQQPSNLLFSRVAGDLHSCDFFACFQFVGFFLLPPLGTKSAELGLNLFSMSIFTSVFLEGSRDPMGHCGWFLSLLQISLSGISMAPAPTSLKAPTVTCTCDLLPCFGTLSARTPINSFSVRSSSTTASLQVTEWTFSLLPFSWWRWCSWEGEWEPCPMLSVPLA